MFERSSWQLKNTPPMGGVFYSRTHGGNPWELIRAHGFPKERILDFSVDVNPLGFPDGLRSVILAHVDDVRCYPDPDARELREAIATYHGIPLETILPGNGAAELITLLARIRPVNRALIVVPTFGEYAWAVEHLGATVSPVPVMEENAFRLDVSEQDWHRRLAHAEVAFLCNPNNPTGAVAPRRDVLELASRCQEAGTLLVIDESFMEFLDDPNESSVVPEAARLDHVAVLRSLTKFFAVPGLRLGYVVTSASLVQRLRALQPPWPLNTFALAAGVHLFTETAYAARSRRAVADARDELQRLLRTIPGLHPFASSVNFILCKLLAPDVTSSELHERLARQGILIRNCDSFTGLEPGRFIRMAVRTHDENARLVSTLREVLRFDGITNDQISITK